MGFAGLCLALLVCACVGADRQPAEVTALLNLSTAPVPPPPPPPLPPLPPPGVPQLGQCQVDVGTADDLQHPNAAMQAQVDTLNAKFRPLLGRDLFVPEDGGRFRITCTVPPGGIALQNVEGKSGAVLPLYQMSGMPPKNFFLDVRRPGVNTAIGAGSNKALQLLPIQAPDTGPQMAKVSEVLPPPNFDVSPLFAVIPESTVTMAPTTGIYQVNNVLRMEVALQPSAGKAATAAESGVQVQVTGVVGPDGCAWKSDYCTDDVITPPIQERFLWDGTPIEPGAITDRMFTEMQAIADALKKTGKPVTSGAILKEFFTHFTYDTSRWLHLHYKVATGFTPDAAGLAAMTPDLVPPVAELQAEIDVPVLVWSPVMASAPASGCNCRLAATAPRSPTGAQLLAAGLWLGLACFAIVRLRRAAAAQSSSS